MPNPELSRASLYVIVPGFKEGEMRPTFFTAVMPALEAATRGNWVVNRLLLALAAPSTGTAYVD